LAEEKLPYSTNRLKKGLLLVKRQPRGLKTHPRFEDGRGETLIKKTAFSCLRRKKTFARGGG